MSTAATALRPWLIVAALLPVVGIVAWANGVFDDPPDAPVADRNVRELERTVTPPPEAREPGRTPLVVFLGDSRYLRALRTMRFGPGVKRPETVDTPAGRIEILTYFTRAGSHVGDVGRFLETMFSWKPDAIVVQPELMVEETSFRGLAPAAISSAARRRNWDTRVGLWARKAAMPEGGAALESSRALAERARRAGVRLMVAQIPPSARIARAVPPGYYDRVRELTCSVLQDCERDYLSFEPSYPDDYFRDPLHLNRKGRQMFYPKLMEAVARAVNTPR